MKFVEDFRAELWEQVRRSGIATAEGCDEITTIAVNTLFATAAKEEHAVTLTMVQYLITVWRNIERAKTKNSSATQKSFIATLTKGAPGFKPSTIKKLEGRILYMSLEIARAQLLGIRNEIAALRTDRSDMKRLEKRHGSMAAQMQEVDDKILTLELARRELYEKFPPLSDMQKGD